MKVRNGFVSNSSSTSFCIYNNTVEVKTWKDFFQENDSQIREWLEEWDSKYYDSLTGSGVSLDYKIALMLEELKEECDISPGQNSFIFGDEQGTLVGRVFDYALRGGSPSESFSWEVDEYLR